MRDLAIAVPLLAYGAFAYGVGWLIAWAHGPKRVVQTTDGWWEEEDDI